MFITYQRRRAIEMQKTSSANLSAFASRGADKGGAIHSLVSGLHYTFIAEMVSDVKF